MSVDPNVWRRLRINQGKSSGAKKFGRDGNPVGSPVDSLICRLMTAKGLVNMIKAIFGFNPRDMLHPYFEEFLNDPIVVIEMNKIFEGIDDRCMIALWAKHEKGMRSKDAAQHIISTRTGRPISSTQVLAIYNKAIRKMRHPVRIKALKKVLGYSYSRRIPDDDVIELEIVGKK